LVFNDAWADAIHEEKKMKNATAKCMEKIDGRKNDDIHCATATRTWKCNHFFELFTPSNENKE